ncbi:MAG TPA: four helix bundle protein [Tenuifilaceae bacterium]|nr:four helix bundle protein [Tenuifilaceae bacterium]HOZ14336.1 four helix bundle protein [Tenuifilaceae bacterium]HPI44203.1 four helix bundle protein [Tenuifilaceae bacterium]HPN20347.1 four helix bundle protein [Tenuifilaceae bacterium]HPV55578.1 four helix bundle protein [Tenuifilaceae bacterium]
MNQRTPTNVFTDLLVWQKAHKMVLFVYSLTKRFPHEEVYALTSQFRRSAISVPANIAEGYKRKGKRDKLKFLNIAQGSLEESRYYGILSKDLEYINIEQFEKLNQSINEVSYLLNSYASTISRNAKSNSSNSL